MKAKSLFARVLAAAILVFVFVVSVYRAKTQTIAHDEAITYERFLDQGVEHVLHYEAVNHVLQTLLAKPIVKTQTAVPISVGSWSVNSEAPTIFHDNKTQATIIAIGHE